MLVALGNLAAMDTDSKEAIAAIQTHPLKKRSLKKASVSVKKMDVPSVAAEAQQMGFMKANTIGIVCPYTEDSLDEEIELVLTRKITTDSTWKFYVDVDQEELFNRTKLASLYKPEFVCYCELSDLKSQIEGSCPVLDTVEKEIFSRLAVRSGKNKKQFEITRADEESQNKQVIQKITGEHELNIKELCAPDVETFRFAYLAESSTGLKILVFDLSNIVQIEYWFCAGWTKLNLPATEVKKMLDQLYIQSILFPFNKD